MKFAIALITTIVLCILGVVCVGEDISDFETELINRNRALRITGWKGSKRIEEIVIPSEIDGLPVTSIGSKVFAGCENISSVEIPNSITEIYRDAFIGLNFDLICSSDSYAKDYAVNWPWADEDSFGFDVRSEVRAYHNMTADDGTDLTSQMMGIQNFTTDEIDYIFYTAMAFMRVARYDLAESGFALIGDNHNADEWLRECQRNRERLINFKFEKNRNGIVVSEYTGYEKDVVIPIGVISLSDGNEYFGGVFRNNTRIESVVIPETVKNIGAYAFSGCSNLKNITISEGVEEIKSGAFSKSSIEEVVVPRSVKQFSYAVFRDCNQLKNAVFEFDLKSIPASTFKGCSQLMSFDVPEGVVTLDSQCFSGCTNLRSVFLPTTLTAFTSFGTFEGCSSLEHVILPEGMNDLGWITFSGCASLKSIIIPEGIITIGRETFNQCVSLQEVYLPTKLEEIGDGAFANCQSLQRLVIPQTVKKISVTSFLKNGGMGTDGFLTGFVISNEGYRSTNVLLTEFVIYEGTYAHKFFDEANEKGAGYNFTFVEDTVESNVGKLGSVDDLREIVHNADQSYEIGDYSQAALLYRRAAEQGDARAQYCLGYMYRHGEGVQQNDSEAIKWYSLSSKQGNTDAQCGLAYMYLYGYGVDKNSKQAFDLFCNAAEQGSVNAQYNLGILLEYGEGVEKDLEKAKTWYGLAAEQGLEKAKERLEKITH